MLRMKAQNSDPDPIQQDRVHQLSGNHEKREIAVFRRRQESRKQNERDEGCEPRQEERAAIDDRVAPQLAFYADAHDHTPSRMGGS
jgi:hypothetical protein